MSRVSFFVLAVIGMFSVENASAADFSFSNNLASDNAVASFTFSVVGPGNTSVTLRTYSFAGGTNAAGTLIPRGGFDPILAVFDSTGALIDQNDDGDCPPLVEDPVRGDCYDTYLEVDLAPGDYTVTVMQYDNFATGPNLSDGFDGTDAVNFDDGTSFWAFDILGADTASGPPVVPPAPPPAGGATAIPTVPQWAMIMLVVFVGLIGSGAAMRLRPRIIG